MAFLLAGSMVSLSSAASAREQAVAAAAENSKSSIDAISLALYEAVLATPSEAVSICEELLSQRGGWSAYECEVLMRAVLLARPDLKAELVKYSKKQEVNAEASALVKVFSQVAIGSAATDAVVGTVIQNTGSRVIGESQSVIPPTITNVHPELGEFDVVPSPGDMSPNR